MYKIMNSSKRSFIVGAEDVVKGGEQFVSRTKSDTKEKVISVRLAPGNEVYEVSDTLGAMLATYAGIVVVEKPKAIKKGK